MDWTTLFLSFKGRLNRGRYWLAVLTFMLVWGIYFLSILTWLGGFDTDTLLQSTGAAVAILLVGAVLFLLILWSGLAVGVKRLHDREKSGWWILLFWLGPGIFSSGSDMTTGAISVAFFVIGIGLARLGPGRTRLPARHRWA